MPGTASAQSLLERIAHSQPASQHSRAKGNVLTTWLRRDLNLDLPLTATPCRLSPLQTQLRIPEPQCREWQGYPRSHPRMLTARGTELSPAGPQESPPEAAQHPVPRRPIVAGLTLAAGWQKQQGDRGPIPSMDRPQKWPRLVRIIHVFRSP